MVDLGELCHRDLTTKGIFMENERSDPPLAALCSHQVPRYKCPECQTERPEQLKPSDLIRSIVSRVSRQLHEVLEGDFSRPASDGASKNPANTEEVDRQPDA